jgi:RNA polymerase sigma-70 factor (ECF subfamily)
VNAEPTPHAGQPDEALVARCRERNDEDAFAEIVRRYRSPVFRLAVSVFGQGFAPEAEDVAQEVLLKVHGALRSFRGDAKLSTWIYRITFNVAVSAKARMRYRAPHLGEEVLVSVPAADPTPLDQLEARRRGDAVLECIRELPEVYQSALRLHYWLGTSMAEMAVLLDAPENTVKSYLHRARRLLQAMLAERGFDAR